MPLKCRNLTNCYAKVLNLLYADYAVPHTTMERQDKVYVAKQRRLTTTGQIVQTRRRCHSISVGLCCWSIVFVCGTVHRGNAVLGLFEQQFGLVRDPTTENNWKISFTRLALSTRIPSQLPMLAMTQNMLTA